MPVGTVTVPDTVLLDRHLTASAKLVWIYQGWRGAAASGLTPRTAQRALSELAGWGLRYQQPTATERCALFPADLLADEDLRVWEQLMYGVLQFTSHFDQEKGKGRFTYCELGTLAGIGLNAVKRSVGTLVTTEWLRTSQDSRYKPVKFTLLNPVAERCERMIAAMKERLSYCTHGEGLMREWLNVLVDNNNYQDNARPGWLNNGYTGELMQLDRQYHEPPVAWEFNGAQHYRQTKKFPGKIKLEKQRARDFMKRGMCVDRGIHLVVVHAEDLTLQRMRAKVGNLLKLREDLTGLERVIEYLEEESWNYRLSPFPK